MGAVNAVAIAAATPQAIAVLPTHALRPVTREMAEPTVAPRCTNGPYCPAEAPTPRPSRLATTDRPPSATGMRPRKVCTDSTTSAGPRALPFGSVRQSNPTSSPPTTGTANNTNSHQAPVCVWLAIRGSHSRRSLRKSRAHINATVPREVTAPSEPPSSRTQPTLITMAAVGLTEQPSMLLGLEEVLASWEPPS